MWCAALDQQKASLEQLAEKRLGWSLRDKEREMQQELDYQASCLPLCVCVCVCVCVDECACVFRQTRSTGSIRVS